MNTQTYPVGTRFELARLRRRVADWQVAADRLSGWPETMKVGQQLYARASKLEASWFAVEICCEICKEPAYYAVQIGSTDTPSAGVCANCDYRPREHNETQEDPATW